MVDGLAAIWKVAVAMVPFPIMVAFWPNARHMFPLQETDFPAAASALPVVTLTPVMSEVYPKDH